MAASVDIEVIFGEYCEELDYQGGYCFGRLVVEVWDFD